MMLLDNETVSLFFSYLAGRLRCFVKAALPFVFFKAHPNFYNSGMGRMRIKKKDAVIPFRETLAYRMIFAGGSLIVFIVALYVLVGAISTSTATAIVAGAIGVAAAFGIFYNLDHLRDAKVPKRTLHRMKRR
jgi:hypothetical protein